MPKKLHTAEEICDAISELEESTKKALLVDIVTDLVDFAKQGPGGYQSPDTWAAGFADCIGTVNENWAAGVDLETL